MALYGYERAVRMTQDRAAAAVAAGATPGPGGSGQKLHGSATFKRRAYLVADAQGPYAMLTDSEGHLELLTAPSMSIRGGTDEIQHNIVGERVLGLPAEPPRRPGRAVVAVPPRVPGRHPPGLMAYSREAVPIGGTMTAGAA